MMTLPNPTARLDRFWLSEKLSPSRRQFVKFLAVGVLNTIVGYGIFAVLIVATVKPGIALLLSTMLGVLFNYLSTGRFVFATRGLRRLPFFVAVYGLTFLFNLESLKLLSSTRFDAIQAQAMLLPLMVILNFVLNKIFVFRIARKS